MACSTSERVRQGRRRPLRVAGLLAVLFLAVPAGSWLYAQGWAWYHFRAAQAALERRRWVQARAHLKLCLEVWAGRAAAQLLAAQAARRSGDFDEAARQLDLCEQQHGATEAIHLERALLHAQRGELPGLPVRAENPLMVELSLRDPPPEMTAVRDY